MITLIPHIINLPHETKCGSKSDTKVGPLREISETIQEKPSKKPGEELSKEPGQKPSKDLSTEPSTSSAPSKDSNQGRFQMKTQA